jgi:transcriptional regulator with XRE-family HTH domain
MKPMAEGKLREVRQLQGRTLREVAREAGVDHAYLSRVERGLQRPTVDLLLRVGRVLGLKPLVD